MSANTFGKLFRFTTFGESHGPAIGCIVDGTPPGILLSEDDIQTHMNKRRPGQSKYTTQRKESDTVKITEYWGLVPKRFIKKGADKDDFEYTINTNNINDLQVPPMLVQPFVENAIKHGFLGCVAEDNADIERASYHWAICKQLLEEELDAYRGGAKPTLQFDPSGSGSRVPNIL